MLGVNIIPPYPAAPFGAAFFMKKIPVSIPVELKTRISLRQKTSVCITAKWGNVSRSSRLLVSSINEINNEISALTANMPSDFTISVGY